MTRHVIEIEIDDAGWLGRTLMDYVGVDRPDVDLEGIVRDALDRAGLAVLRWEVVGAGTTTAGDAERETAMAGKRIEVWVDPDQNIVCPNCGGTGNDPETMICVLCGGEGVLRGDDDDEGDDGEGDDEDG